MKTKRRVKWGFWLKNFTDRRDDKWGFVWAKDYDEVMKISSYDKTRFSLGAIMKVKDFRNRMGV